MDAELLLRAMDRAMKDGTAPAALGPDFDNPRHLAVAEVLNAVYCYIDPDDTTRAESEIFSAVCSLALAYLGESACAS